jgi:simple sugar transport system ATP-binding protein
VGDYLPSELSVDRLGLLMTGARLTVEKAEEAAEAFGEALLRVDRLSRRGQYHDISFALRSGEIIGFAGLTGAGRTEVALSLFGLNPPDSGRIVMEGREIRTSSPLEAVKAGIVLVSEDRHTQGLFPRKSICVNIASSVYERIKTRFGLVRHAAERQLGDTWVGRVGVKTPSSEEAVQSLSGGNQQKVVLAKWLATRPKVLILDNPTAGIDVGSKQEIHEIIHDLARQRHGVIMISDDLDELAYDCNRVFLLQAGALTGEFSGKSLTPQLLSAALRQAA